MTFKLVLKIPIAMCVPYFLFFHYEFMESESGRVIFSESIDPVP